MNTNTSMGNLRELLYQPPSQHAWQEICRALYAWPDDAALEVAVDYATELLERWPDELRRALGSWWKMIDQDRYTRIWPLVRNLEIFYGELGDPGALALAASPHLRTLTHLTLSFDSISDRGAVALATSPYLGTLTHMDLSVNEIHDEGLRALITSPGLQHLTHLNLQKNRVSPEGVRLLIELPELQRFASLQMAGNPTGDAAELLARSRFLSDEARASLYAQP